MDNLLTEALKSIAILEFKFDIIYKILYKKDFSNYKIVSMLRTYLEIPGNETKTDIPTKDERREGKDN